MIDMYKRNERIVLRKCGDFHFLIDPHCSYNREDEDILQLDEIGVLIWEFIDTPRNIDEIVSIILDNIMDEKTKSLISVISEDVTAFLKQLIDAGYIGVSR